MTKVNNMLDARFSQMQDELTSLIHTRVEIMSSDLGLRVEAIEILVTNLETATREQIDLGAAATKRINTHANEQIAGINAKLDSVDRRLGDIDTQIADMGPAVANYLREGMQALHVLALSSGGVRASITDLKQADEKRSKNFEFCAKNMQPRTRPNIGQKLQSLLAWTHLDSLWHRR
jgi:hypothetical protein